MDDTHTNTELPTDPDEIVTEPGFPPKSIGVEKITYGPWLVDANGSPVPSVEAVRPCPVVTARPTLFDPTGEDWTYHTPSGRGDL